MSKNGPIYISRKWLNWLYRDKPPKGFYTDEGHPQTASRRSASSKSPSVAVDLEPSHQEAREYSQGNSVSTHPQLALSLLQFQKQKR